MKGYKLMEEKTTNPNRTKHAILYKPYSDVSTYASIIPL